MAEESWDIELHKTLNRIASGLKGRENDLLEEVKEYDTGEPKDYRGPFDEDRWDLFPKEIPLENYRTIPRWAGKLFLSLKFYYRLLLQKLFFTNKFSS